MLKWTWLQIKTKVQTDLDLQSEDFITPDELLGYCNEAIDDVEAEIHTLYEDYFMTKAALALTSGSATVALPSDIYASKIRRVVYDDGTTKYVVNRLKRIEDTSFVQASDDYSYLLLNDSVLGMQMNLYPSSRETNTANIVLWYIRNAARLAVDTDTCDIPEFVNYVIQHMKVRCYEKEGNPNLDSAIGQKERLKTLMVETLENMTDDEDNTILPDMSFYEDFDLIFKRRSG